MTADLPWISVTSALDEESALICEVRRERRDGQWTHYQVRIQEREGVGLVVREVEPRRLPVFCPERHINGDGSFCLGWEPEGPRLPTTPEEARAWWSLLRGYLRLQDAATTTRTWPTDCAWPHGDAAEFEWKLETLFATLPPSIERAWRAGTLRPFAGGPCPCGSGHRLEECHERDIATILSLSNERDCAEADYWRSICWRKCCGSMDGCKLDRDSGIVVGREI